jgi:DEAD/DEAH box helicase domain-containing protein
MINEVFFDIETKKLFQDITTSSPADLGVSIVSVYRRQLDDNFNEVKGEMFSFWEQDFKKMWDIFSTSDRIIGFNSFGFDIPALVPLCPYNFKKLSHFDILEKIKNSLGFRLSLDAVARETVGHTKIDVGTNAVLYWNQGTGESLAKLKKYCEMDVLVTRDVYDYGLKNGHLKYKDKWNTPRLVEINFSYPKVDKSHNQMGLF